MKKLHASFVAVLSVLTLVACGENKEAKPKSTHPDKASMISTGHAMAIKVEERLVFIRENFGKVEKGLETKAYKTKEIVSGQDGDKVTLVESRSDNDELRHVSLSSCMDNSCNDLAFYLWDNEIMYSLTTLSDQNELGLVVTEERKYFLENKPFKCIERKAEGSDSYSQLKDQLVMNRPIDAICSEEKNSDFVTKLSSQTEESLVTFYKSLIK